jgi:hypothetical protein
MGTCSKVLELKATNVAKEKAWEEQNELRMRAEDAIKALLDLQEGCCEVITEHEGNRNRGLRGWGAACCPVLLAAVAHLSPPTPRPPAPVPLLGLSLPAGHGQRDALQRSCLQQQWQRQQQWQ